jgi:hypothetical protein
MYVGGKFHKIGTAGAYKLAAVNYSSGVLDTTFKPSVQIIVYGITLGPDGSVYAAEAGTGGRAVEYSSTGATGWTFTTDGDVRALTYYNGVVYVGGHFDNACKSANVGAHGLCLDGSVSRVKLAAVDAATGTLQAWDPQGNGIHGVFAVASSTGLGSVAASGEFTTLKGVAHGRFAQFH